MTVIVCSAASVSALAMPLLTLWQLSGYRIKTSRKSVAAVAACFIVAVVSAAASAAMYTYVAGEAVYWILPALTLICACAVGAWEMRAFSKTPPVFTARFIRLCVVTAVAGAAAGAAARFVPQTVGVVGAEAAFIPVAIFAAPLCALCGKALTAPIEKAIAAFYLNRCRRDLRSRRGMAVVGITGSFGKTGVKKYLTAMLSRKYRTQCTPKSFNTPMGICRSVNGLPADTEIFVVEMGARRRGDIARLCRLTDPCYGVITGVTAQHMETFGSIDNVYAAKKELPDSVCAGGGTCCFNTANALAARMYSECGGRKISSGPNGDVRAEDVSVGSFGSAFTLRFPSGEKVRCKTRLLGRANVQNVTLAAAAAYDLGVSPADIADAISELTPAEHRMQPIVSRGMTIIDDSYNANPEGVRNAFDAIARFEGKKAVATQGIVEGGKDGARLNEELGRELAAVADVVVLIGKNAPDIRRGLTSAGYRGTLFVVRGLEDAKHVFATGLGGVSVLLIQNDLPDNY